MRSLPETSHEHHDRIIPHVDRLPELAEMLGNVPATEFAAAFDEQYRFVVGQLVPHMAAIEATLYGDLERLMGGRHSMAPMREEHQHLRRLIGVLGDVRPLVLRGELGEADRMTLRRVLYRLYSILKVHLAEEEMYLGVLDHNLSDEEKDALARGVDHAAAEPV